MKSVEQVLTEPAPATVNYRTLNNRRTTLRDLIDGATRPISPGTSAFVKSKDGVSPRKLTWINGVFIPVLLNIWGVIMFLRIGWVVGQAGIILGTVIVVLANTVTFITGLSLCAICTNGEVRGGGLYFLISRSLGPLYGGTLGILFFIAQAVAVSLYVIGFAESVVDLIITSGGDYFTGDETNDIRVIGILTSTALFLLSLVGIGWYAKTQTGLLVILVVAIFSVYIGAFFPKVPNEDDNLEAGFVGFRKLRMEDGELRNLYPNFQTDPDTRDTKQGFFTVFSVYFPAVTGIMAGANLSGDLDDASKAIPKGTLSAIAVTFVSYLLLLWITGLTCLACVELTDDEVFSIENLTCSFDKMTKALLSDKDFQVPEAGLLYDSLIMKHVSLWAPLVYIGVFAATLSSALASLVSAPRIIQSIANDKLFPWAWFNFFGVGRGINNEPVRGYCLTYLISVGCCAIGKLDLIAPIISNFFIVSYALANYACFASSQSKAPNWRPSFKYYNKYLSAFGALLCVAVMFAMDWIMALVTVVFAVLVMLYLKRLNSNINWGEAPEAQKYTLALTSLETLQMSEKEHIKTFRPQFLVMTGDLLSRIWLVKFVSFFQPGGGGIMLCADIIPNAAFAIQASLENGQASDALEDTSGYNNSSISGGTTVKDLFQSANYSQSSPQDAAKINAHLNENDVTLTLSTKEFAASYDLIKRKRQDGHAFLNNKHIWGGKRCKGAFYDAIISSSLFAGFHQTLQLGGLGKLRPNTVVVGFKADYMSRKIEEIADYEKLLRAVLSVQIGLLVVRDDNFLFEINMTKTISFFPFIDRLMLRDADSDDDETDVEEGMSKVVTKDFKADTGNKTGNESVNANEHIPAGNSQSWANGRSKSSANFKERIEKYRAGDIEYIENFENSLPSSIGGDNIDVWWLADDGGLTMLLPQLLIQNPLFKAKNLRVMAVTNKFQSPEETSRLKKAELRMVHLLHKFRIKATTVGVDLNLEEPLNSATTKRFEQCMGMPINELDDSEKAKTIYNLRLSEEIRKTSRAASIVFMILPLPESSLRAKLLTVWLDMFSYEMPPMVMMRGNNENVLTFFC